jgi:hypothetical protein
MDCSKEEANKALPPMPCGGGEVSHELLMVVMKNYKCDLDQII